MNLELDFRRHIYGGDVGQRVELGQQHSFKRYSPRVEQVSPLWVLLFSSEVEVCVRNFIPIARLSRLPCRA